MDWGKGKKVQAMPVGPVLPEPQGKRAGHAPNLSVTAPYRGFTQSELAQAAKGGAGQFAQPEDSEPRCGQAQRERKRPAVCAK